MASRSFLMKNNVFWENELGYHGHADFGLCHRLRKLICPYLHKTFPYPILANLDNA